MAYTQTYNREAYEPPPKGAVQRTGGGPLLRRASFGRLSIKNLYKRLVAQRLCNCLQNNGWGFDSLLICINTKKDILRRYKYGTRVYHRKRHKMRGAVLYYRSKARISKELRGGLQNSMHKYIDKQ